MKVKFGFERVDNKILVTSVMRKDNEKIYQFPKELTSGEYHSELFCLAIIKNGVKGMVNYRYLDVTLDENLKKIYLDNEENFVFRSIYLDEMDEELAIQKKARKKTTNVTGNEERIEMLNLIRQLQANAKADKDYDDNRAEERKEYMQIINDLKEDLIKLKSENNVKLENGVK